MLIDFNAIRETVVPGMNDGEGVVGARMQVNDSGRFVLTRIPSGSSIGVHEQRTSDDINYVISGTGIAVCDGTRENLVPGVCHVCPTGSFHSIVNTGTDDLLLFTFVAAG